MNKLIVNYGNWYEHSSPFKHYRADNVLDSKTYAKIGANFIALQNGELKNSNGETYQLEKLSQNYDALMLGMDNELANYFKPFFTIDFLKSIADFLNIPFNYQIDGGLHSNPKNSKTGWIHNDLCYAYFDSNYFKEDKLTFPKRDSCDYFTGRKTNDSASPQKFVRAAALIYYLCNHNWKDGDGGETALYSAKNISRDTISELVAPKDNSLILFECSPHSYHRFVNNPGRTRNSLIFWLHSTPEFSESQWPNALK